MEKNGRLFVKCKGGMTVNSKLLKKIIRRRGLSVGELARLAGIRKWILRIKLWGLGEFRFLEIVSILKILKIDRELAEQIFFS